MLRRREFLESAARWLLLLGLPFAAGCRPPGPSCSDEDLLSTPERMLRESHAYSENSPLGAEQSCARCQFFEPGEAGQCGGCRLLGGRVNPAGRCNGWVEKA